MEVRGSWLRSMLVMHAVNKKMKLGEKEGVETTWGAGMVVVGGSLVHVIVSCANCLLSQTGQLSPRAKVSFPHPLCLHLDLIMPLTHSPLFLCKLHLQRRLLERFMFSRNAFVVM